MLIRKQFRQNRITWLFGFLLMTLVACAPAETAVSPTQDSDADQSPVAPTNTSSSVNKYDEYELVTLLPRDAIPAIDNPQFLSVSEADEYYDPQEPVIGVEFNGDARAYSIPFLSNHEIVNDTVGGVPIAVTW